MPSEQALQRLSYWYIIPPIATLVLILPPISELPPFLPKGTTNPNMVQWLIAVPFYVGLLAAPGYLYAWTGHNSRRALKGWKQRWIEGSLLMATAASLVGGFLSIPTVIVAPFAFWSFVMSVKLLWRFKST